MNLIANFFLPVMDFLPFRSFPTTLALYSSFVCLLHVLEHQFTPAPGPLHMLFSVLCTCWALSCALTLWVPSGSAQMSLPLRGFLWPLISNRPPTLLSPAPPSPPTTGQRAHDITLAPKTDLLLLALAVTTPSTPQCALRVLVALWMQQDRYFKRCSNHVLKQ